MVSFDECGGEFDADWDGMLVGWWWNCLKTWCH